MEQPVINGYDGCECECGCVSVVGLGTRGAEKVGYIAAAEGGGCQRSESVGLYEALMAAYWDTCVVNGMHGSPFTPGKDSGMRFGGRGSTPLLVNVDEVADETEL